MTDTPPDAPIPACVRTFAGDDSIRVVWGNEQGGRTYEIGSGAARRFVKWSPSSSPIRLAPEAARLRWAVVFTPVPRVLDHGSDDDGEWLLTEALPGENAVTARWTADPATATKAIGEGLRAFHDALPVAHCPFDWTAEARLAELDERLAAGAVDMTIWHGDTKRLGLDRALEIVRNPPPVDRLVVCHGDTCAPNTLIGDDGRWSGHVDLGSLGVACRWADLAIATWSTQWNYGDGWERAVLDAYGVEEDHERTAYYRVLWDLGP